MTLVCSDFTVTIVLPSPFFLADDVYVTMT